MEIGEPGRHRYAPTTEYRAPSNSFASIDTAGSVPSSGGRFDDVDRRLRDPAEHRFQAGYTMATASAVPASAPYRPNPPASSYASSYASGAVQSSTESRRTSDESEHTHRRSQQSDMSLPPIHEALSAPAEGSRDPLRSLPPPHSFPSRAPPPEPLSSFPASSRSTLSTRANVPPPLPIFDMHQHQHQAPSQSYIGRDRDAEFRQAAEPPPPQLSGGYSHYPPQHNPPSQHPPPHYPQSGPRPPGQLPLPSLPPASPRQPGSAMISPSETGRPPYHPDEESARKRNNEGTLGRPFEGYPYLDALNKIALSSRIIFNFAEAFDVAAREQNTGSPLPSRLPNETEITVMMENVSNIQQSLMDMNSMIQHNRMHSERPRDVTREPAVRKPLEEEDVHMYNDPSKASRQQHHSSHHPHHPMHHPSAYTLAEVKKRRGRAAPPGRCHSCNRVDTPEWRRGPDGARTLCNACGLHYAKLERKRQSEQRSIRPKPVHDP